MINNNSDIIYDSNDRERAKLLTLTAFLIGYALIDNLNSVEQNSVGNFFVLIGQTLVTNSSENFRRDQRENLYSFNDNNNDCNPMDMLKRTKDIFDREINNIK